MKKLRLGVLGLGEGRSIISAALSSKLWELARICDLNEQLCKERAAEFQFPHYTLKFEEMLAQNEFLEYAEVFGNYYGTANSVLEQAFRRENDVLLDIDVQGERQVKTKMPEAVSIFVLLQILPFFSLLVWITFPLAYTNVRSVLAATDRTAFAKGIKRTSMLHLQFGAMLALGIVVAALSRPLV